MSLFLIHGWATTPAIWPDWLTTNPAFSYDSLQYPDYSHLVATFTAHYQAQGKPLTLLGWSLGGMLALQLAADHPEKINKLILLSSTARFTSCENYPAGLAPGIIKNLGRKLLKNKWQTQLDFYKLMFSPLESASLETFNTAMTPPLANLEIQTLQAGLQYLLATDLRSLLPTIQTPCHIVHGTEDTICPLAGGQYLATMLPNSTLTLVPGAGHIPFYTQSEYCQSKLQASINPT